MSIKQLLKNYSKYVDGYEFDEEASEREGRKNYWIYLKKGYESDWRRNISDGQFRNARLFFKGHQK